MKRERFDVEFPLWRKKVDSNLFENRSATIPIWVCRMWNLDAVFAGGKMRSDAASEVEIQFNGAKFSGNIACTKPKNRADKVYRLFFRNDLKNELKEVFLMTFMRDIEGRLRADGPDGVEVDIPFWEFLDIEFDEKRKIIILTAHYTQEPLFPELFQRLTTSPILKRVHDEIGGKAKPHIYKQDWKKRDEFETEIGAENVIYMLIDTNSRKFYVGQAENLIKRFRQGHPSIKDWNYYRYDAIPSCTKEIRVAIERMVIRNFASVLKNNKVESMEISDYTLANDKIDP